MELEQATEEDMDTLVDLWKSLSDEMIQYSDLNMVSEDFRESARQGFRKHLKSNNISVYLLRENGETIGFMDLKRDEHSSRKNSDYTKILDLFIKEKHRNQGHGTSAIEKAKEIAKENGSDYIKVSSEWKNEDARRFYERNGFTEKQVKYVQRLE